MPFMRRRLPPVILLFPRKHLLLQPVILLLPCLLVINML